VYTRLCKAVIDDPAKLALNLAVWEALRDFNKELRAPMANPKDLAERKAKSLLVEDLAVAYMDAYNPGGVWGHVHVVYAPQHGPRSSNDFAAPLEHQRRLAAGS
jgi:hypothetical protein